MSAPTRYAWHRAENQYFQTSARRAVTALLNRAGAFPIAQTAIADIGCGHGQWLLEFLQWGATPGNLHGIDRQTERIAYASERLRGVDLRCGEAEQLPWPDASLGLVTQFTLFSSLPDAQTRARVAAEMRRVLRPGGHMVWYDMMRGNPRRPDVHALGRRDVRELFPGCEIQFAGATVAPPVARSLLPVSWAAVFALEAFPPACTHLAALITPR